MKKRAFLVGIVSLATLLSGCGVNQNKAHVEAGHQAEAETAAHGHDHQDEDTHSTHGVEFKEGLGLTIPTITRETLGLKIVDVEEGKSKRRIELSLRVFKAEGNILLASGPVDTNLAVFLQPGRAVSLEGTPGAPDGGEIFRVNADAAKLTGMAEVVVRVPASDTLQIGAFLDGVVTVITPEDVVLIPKDALLKTAEGYFAYVVNGDSLFRTKIGVGGQEGDTVEVTDGLYTGDRVVLQPIMSLWLAELQAIRGGKACADGH
jgi:hypothetical protein